jgi:uncharacterized protein with GYD domain
VQTPVATLLPWSDTAVVAHRDTFIPALLEKGKDMASNTRYFVLANYTQKAIAGMVQAPTDRAAAVKKICKAVGVKFISLDMCRGAYDIVVVAESDSYDRVLGLKMAVAASGAVSEVHILEPMDPTAALEHAGAAAKVYTPAG